MDIHTGFLYNKSLRFLSFRPRSVSEMQKYLVKNKATEIQIAEIIQKLNDLSFLNDIDFAEKWVEDRKKSHPRSLNILKLELRLKGISPEIIEEVISSRKEEGEDLIMAKTVIQKLLPKIERLSLDEIKKKLISRLQSKGFTWEIIKVAIDESLKEV